MKAKTKDKVFYFILLIPAMVLMILFFLTPAIQSFLLSFTDSYGMKTDYKFIGIDNYIEAFHDRSFTQTIGNTLEYAMITVILGNVVSLILALVLDSKIKGKSLFRTCFFVPNIMSLLVVGYIWSFVYAKILPDIVEKLTGSGIAVLGNKRWVVFAIAVVGIWNSAGYYMVIYIAALQSVSEDLIEAARIDGASYIQSLLKVKLPIIAPTIITCLILAVSAHMKVFELPYTMTSGGPVGASSMMVYKIYTTAYNAGRNGYASALSIILFVIIAVISLGLNAIMKTKEDNLE